MTQTFSSVKFVIFFESLVKKYVKKSALIFDQLENNFFLSFNELDGLLFIAAVVFSVCNLEFVQKIDLQKAVSHLSLIDQLHQQELTQLSHGKCPSDLLAFYPSFYPQNQPLCYCLEVEENCQNCCSHSWPCTSSNLESNLVCSTKGRNSHWKSV